MFQKVPKPKQISLHFFQSYRSVLELLEHESIRNGDKEQDVTETMSSDLLYRTTDIKKYMKYHWKQFSLKLAYMQVPWNDYTIRQQLINKVTQKETKRYPGIIITCCQKKEAEDKSRRR